MGFLAVLLASFMVLFPAFALIIGTVLMASFGSVQGVTMVSFTLAALVSWKIAGDYDSN